LSVITPTLPLVSTMMCSNMTALRVSHLSANVPAHGVGFKWAQSS
jgi:hypothetical protein